MKFVDEYRDPAQAQRLLAAIRRRSAGPMRIMEICGGHTHAIYKSGLDQLLPEGITFLHGPGCPVCVTPALRIDQAIALAEGPGHIVATYGDMLRVPGARGSLRQAQARGADVRIVYSSLDAVDLAARFKDREVVFFGVGFETTAPANGMSILRAARLGLENFSVLGNHVLVPPVLRFLLDAPGTEIDAFIGPGHVGTVVGSQDYAFLPRDYGRPVVIAGFEPNDLLEAVLMLVRQQAEGRCALEVQYRRAVREEGSPVAREVMRQVFEVVDQEWRGIGRIPASGLGIRQEYAAYDALRRYAGELPEESPADVGEYVCGAVVQGAKSPLSCPAFGVGCTPEHPFGPGMVSSEGACAALYHYRRTSPGKEAQP